MAVYTQVGEDELTRLLARYDIGALESFEGITQGVENSNYRLTTTAGKYILTLYEKRVKREDLPFFINLMWFMAEAGIDCPHPVADRDDTILQEVAGRPAAIITFLNGVSSPAPSAEECFAAGEALARLHLAGQGYTAMRRPNALGHDSWEALLRLCRKDENIAPDILATISTRLEQILARWPDDLPHGIIHGDLFPDNVFFTDNKVTGIFDFYFACNDMLAYDLAITINAWCFDSGGAVFHKDKSANMIAGYQFVRPMDASEIAAMPVLCFGAAMRFYLTRLYDVSATPADAQVRPHDPEDYRRRLDFHAAATDPADYGFKL